MYRLLVVEVIIELSYASFNNFNEVVSIWFFRVFSL